MLDLKKERIRQKYWELWDRAQRDPEYAAMFAEMDRLERRYEAVLEQLPNFSEDTIRDYVSQCEGMSRRMLELACEELLFPSPRR